MNISDLKRLLYNDILLMKEEENQYRKDIVEKLKKFEKLIDYIEKDITSNIGSKKFNEEYKGIYPDKKLPSIKSNYDYFKLLKQIKQDYEFNKMLYNNIYAESFVYTKNLSNKIIHSLKSSIPLNREEINYIEKRLKKEQIPEKDIVSILEQIHIHNIHSTIKKPDTSRLYQVRDILNIGFEDIKLPKKSNDKLDSIADNIIKSTTSMSKKETFQLLDTLSYLTKEEKDYLYIKILNIYQNKMLSLKEMLSQLEIYKDKEAVNIIKNEFFDLTEKYSIIRKKYEKNSINEETITEELIDEDIKKLYYATNNKENENCYFIRDLKNIREESYNRIFELLEEFKKDENNGKLKKVSGYENTTEIKDDQIRIILRDLGNNNYSVEGVFLKKDDNDREAYRTVGNRPTADIDDEYSELVESYFEEFVKENARKGTRK